MATNFHPIQNAIKVICIECKEPSAVVCVDVSGGNVGRFQCCECEAQFYPSDVKEMIEAAKGWAKVLAWLESFPTE